MNLSAFFQLVGGLGLLIYGIKQMSESLQAIAGDRMRQLIGSLTNTPWRGVVVGALVTSLIQSSSATTVMTVSFVNAGLMQLKQAIGIVMGANIGTTINAQIIAFKVKDFALPVLALGVALSFFGKKSKHKHFGNGMVGFGLLFLGMANMENSMSFLREMKGSVEFFQMFSTNPLLGVLAGTLLTMLVQASSATIGLTMAMATQGLLTFEAAVPIILGDNIGTTITAVLSCIGTKRAAKQTALSHVLFNTIGVIIFISALPLFQRVVLMTSGDLARQLANTHTLFNIINTVIFLPFTALFAHLIEWLLPVKPEAQVSDVIYMDEKLIDASPAAAVVAVRDEIIHMGHVLHDMMETVWVGYDDNSFEQKDNFDLQEKSVDVINYSISRYAAKVWRKNLSESLSSVLASYVNISTDMERIGDHLTNMMELAGYKSEQSVRFSDEAYAEFTDMYMSVKKSFNTTMNAFSMEDSKIADEVCSILERDIDSKEKQYRKNHIERLNRGECDAKRGVLFCDILSNLERIGDHCNNIAERVIQIKEEKKAESRFMKSHN
ncbi:MAG: Na/Pi cotransporter family protein [Synergistaceae bacterium]|nr:Na/Pi cotransporter family protein [Synergistaceae bacterium]